MLTSLRTKLSSLWNRASAAMSRRGGESDVRKRIRDLQASLERLPDTSPERSGVLNNLANRWRDKFLWTGDRADINAAIDCYGQAIAAAGSPAAANAVRANLAVALTSRYARSGNLEDLETAIQTHRAAIDASPQDSLETARNLGNLSNALHERYYRTRQNADLDEAIRVAEEAIARAPSDSRERVMSTVNLAVSLLERRADGPEAGDVSRAIELLESAAAALPAGSTEHTQVLGNLGAARMVRLEGGASDDSTAVEARSLEELRQVVLRAPAGSPARHASLHVIGRALWRQYEGDRDPARLEAAIESLQAAVAAAPDGASELPHYLNDLGIACSELSFISDSAAGLAQAIAAWVRALLLLDASFVSVPVAYKLGQQNVSASLGIPERLVSAYLMMADRVATGRDRMLRNAMLVAEGSKSRLITQLIGRADLPPPAGATAGQAARERDLLGELQVLDTMELGAQGQKSALADMHTPGRTAKRSALREELEQLWNSMSDSGDDARDYVGLRRGHPVTWDTLSGLANSLGPGIALASMFSTNSRTLLFILRPGQDAPVVAEIEFGRDGWDDLLDRFDKEVRIGSEQSTETWHLPMQPLLESAGKYLRGVERVVLAPQGWGLRLPWSSVALRAGWRAPDDSAMPLITVESLGMLPRLLDRSRSIRGGAVVVGNPTGDLAHAESEAMRIAAMLGVEPLLGAAATKAEVVRRLRGASVAHLATHAHFSPGAPLESGIILADGVLTAREILADSIQLDLLVLSACDTGVAESLGGHEFAGLTQAFLLAGVRCLVASLWEADDEVTSTLMTAFYDRWRSGSDLSLALTEAGAVAREVTGGDWTDLWAAFVLSGDWSAVWPTPVARG